MAKHLHWWTRTGHSSSYENDSGNLQLFKLDEGQVPAVLAVLIQSSALKDLPLPTGKLLGNAIFKESQEM